jgi:hypothetical protein
MNFGFEVICIVKYAYMFAPFIIVIVILGYLYLSSPCNWPKCLPDLLVEKYTTEWPAEGGYVVHVTVKNDGCAESGECLVYCNAISMAPPVGENEIRVQQSWILEELPPGETSTHSFSFDVKVLLNENVGRIEVLVDAKDMVAESNENNNIEWWIWSGE